MNSFVGFVNFHPKIMKGLKKAASRIFWKPVPF